jgi:lysophospholipase L1-like esterase
MSEIAKPLIKYSCERDLVYLSLMNILKLQSWLESKNIEYRFMSYMNYWNNGYIENNLKQPSVNLNLESLVSQIDFSQWIFSDSEKNGIFELANKHNLYTDDGVHPNSDAGNLWSKIILENL